jgi:hypothetical protein
MLLDDLQRYHYISAPVSVATSIFSTALQANVKFAAWKHSLH